jgi:acyl-CoA thioesterase-1
MKLHNIFYALLMLLSFGCGGSSGDSTYVAMGASDATGIGASPITSGYVFRIDDKVSEICEETELNNLGIPGVEADEVQNVELPIAVEIDPKLVTIFVGGNDIVSGRTIEAFEEDVQDILSELTEKTGASIFIANLPDMTQLPTFLEEPDRDVTPERVRDFNAVITRQANAYNVTIVDLFSTGVQDVLISDDGFHPNDDGHQVIAELFLEQIIPQFCGKPYPEVQ